MHILFLKLLLKVYLSLKVHNMVKGYALCRRKCKDIFPFVVTSGNVVFRGAVLYKQSTRKLAQNTVNTL